MLHAEAKAEKRSEDNEKEEKTHSAEVEELIVHIILMLLPSVRKQICTSLWTAGRSKL